MVFIQHINDCHVFDLRFFFRYSFNSNLHQRKFILLEKLTQNFKSCKIETGTPTMKQTLKFSTEEQLQS